MYLWGLDGIIKRDDHDEESTEEGWVSRDCVPGDKIVSELFPGLNDLANASRLTILFNSIIFRPLHHQKPVCLKALSLKMPK